MNRPSTSKERFALFIDKFRKGGYKQKSGGKHDEEKDDDPKSVDSEENKEKKRKRRGYLKQYIRQLWPHWKMVLLLVALAVTVAVLEIAAPLFGRHIIDEILLTEKPNTDKFWELNVVGGMFLFLVIATRSCGMTRAWFQRLLNIRVILTLRRALFERMLKLPLNQLSDMKVGGIISRLTDDINKTTGLLQMAVVSPGVAVLRLMLAMGILIFINWKLAIAALGIIPPIMALSMIAIRRIRPVYRAIRKDVSFVDGRVGEAFHGIRDVRAFGGSQSRDFAVELLGPIDGFDRRRDHVARRILVRSRRSHDRRHHGVSVLRVHAAESGLADRGVTDRTATIDGVNGARVRSLGIADRQA